MSKPKGRRKPLHSEITSLRPAPHAAGPDSFVESDVPPSAELEESVARGAVEEMADPSGNSEAEPAPFASGAEEPTESRELAGSARTDEHEVGGPAPDAPRATSFDDDDRQASPDAGGEEAGPGAGEDERTSLLDALGVDTLRDDREPSNVVSMVSDADETEAFLSGLLEALLFTSQRPLALKEIARAAGMDRQRARELLERLSESYAQRGVCIEEVAGGYVMRSSPRYAPHVQKFLALRPVRLSRAQLETLAIVAYRQPVTKPEVDDIRGVDSGQVLKGLLERNLLKMVGKKDEPGRPMLYGTTNDFLELLNLRSLGELPTLREYTELSEESRRKFAEETGEAPPDDAAAFQSAVAFQSTADSSDANTSTPSEAAPPVTDAGEPPTAAQLESDASVTGDDAAPAQPDAAGSEERSSTAAVGDASEERAASELTDQTEAEESEMSVRITASSTDADPAPVQHQEVAMGEDEDEDDFDEDDEDEDDLEGEDDEDDDEFDDDDEEEDEDEDVEDDEED